MSYKRLPLKAFRQPMVVETGPIPSPPPGGLVVEVKYAGICHSDVHLWDGELFPEEAFFFPRVLGHEIAGVVHSIGEGAQCNLQVGDPCVVFPWSGCTSCEACLFGSQYCPESVGTADSVDFSKNKTYGVFCDGGYQSHCVVHDASFALPVPDKVSLDVASLLCCSGVTSYSAVCTLKDSINQAINIYGKANVVLVGAGGLCLWGIQICRYLFPDKVTICVVDVHEDKLNDAKDAGAHVTVCWDKDPEKRGAAVQQVKAALGGNLNAAVDYTGVPENTFRLFSAAQACATITVVGLAGGTMPQLNMIDVALRAICLRGNFVGSKSDLIKLLDIVNQNKLKPPPITHVGLEDVNSVLDSLRQGKQKGRAIVKL